MKLTKSFSKEQVAPRWYVIDLKDQVLGRVASQIANLLRGKSKPTYTPHADTGDFVIAINAKQIKMTGKKSLQKKYFHHSGFIGGIKEKSFEELLEKKPDRIILKAVKGMLPKTKLGKTLIDKLKVYPDDEHPHRAQNPTAYPLT